MKLNINCIRTLLIYIEENQKISDNGHIQEISDYDCINNIKKFSQEDILYSLKQMRDSDLIQVRICWDISRNNIIKIRDITPKGHEFIANIREESNFNKVMEVAKKVGCFSLNTIQQIAVNVISGAINQHML